ncbi:MULTISPECIES: hypothetical protein [Nocardia]|uniref:hypothetical protein n=1 Tax=Nocardia TaxID=1817 RepID=UPI0024580BB4|nr:MULTISPECIES: hypothetical protein [Nocardia]
MSFALIDITDAAHELGFPFPVSIENSVTVDQVTNVLAAARDAFPTNAVGSWRVPFHIPQLRDGVIENVDMVMVIRVDKAGHPAATILA